MLQQAITRACSEKRKLAPTALGSLDVSINLEKGDYAIQEIQIPKNSNVALYSKDRVRILYVGKRNRPMFVVGENSKLILREKLEIYYNTNNIQGAMQLMIKKVAENAGVEISKGVKFSLFSKKIA
jgi:hypothetical protein